MDLVLLSDTHMAHDDLVVPSCDLLVHAGDWSRRGTEAEARTFLAWLGSRTARARVLTAGNHDHFAAREPEAMRRLAEEHRVTYLVDAEADVLGLRVWASPYTPRFGKWSFQEPLEDLALRWRAIPEGVDVLVTHGPPRGVGDRTFLGAHVGCPALRDASIARAPALHVFGHIHEARGEGRVEGVRTRFVNAASRRLLPFGVRPPIRVAL